MYTLTSTQLQRIQHQFQQSHRNKCADRHTEGRTPTLLEAIRRGSAACRGSLISGIGARGPRSMRGPPAPMSILGPRLISPSGLPPLPKPGPKFGLGPTDAPLPRSALGSTGGLILGPISIPCSSILGSLPIISGRGGPI